MSRICMVGTRALAEAPPFEIRTSKSLILKFVQILNGRISDPYCTSYFWMVSLIIEWLSVSEYWSSMQIHLNTGPLFRS